MLSYLDIIVWWYLGTGDPGRPFRRIRQDEINFSATRENTETPAPYSSRERAASNKVVGLKSVACGKVDVLGSVVLKIRLKIEVLGYLLNPAIGATMNYFQDPTAATRKKLILIHAKFASPVMKKDGNKTV